MGLQQLLWPQLLLPQLLLPQLLWPQRLQLNRPSKIRWRQLERCLQQVGFGLQQVGFGWQQRVGRLAQHFFSVTQLLQPQLSRPSMRSKSSNPKLWLHKPRPSTSDPTTMFHFIEPHLLWDGTVEQAGFPIGVRQTNCIYGDHHRIYRTVCSIVRAPEVDVPAIGMHLAEPVRKAGSKPAVHTFLLRQSRSSLS